jgi:hypothetical protein
LKKCGLGDTKGQENYWKAYMERFQKTREEWEKLHWDGIPKEPASNLELKTARLDHYQVLGLRKYSLYVSLF